MDATIPYEWKEKPVPIVPDPAMKKQVEARWKEYFPDSK
jgi:4-hydroxy-3-polyprenylbenzoate decarboxylase